MAMCKEKKIGPLIFCLMYKAQRNFHQFFILAGSRHHDCGFQSLSSDDDSNESSDSNDSAPNPSKRLCCDHRTGDAVSYICRLKSLRGKFFPQKALALGVPKGPFFGFLQRGNSVVLENGKKVNKGPLHQKFITQGLKFESMISTNLHLSS